MCEKLLFSFGQIKIKFFLRRYRLRQEPIHHGKAFRGQRKCVTDPRDLHNTDLVLFFYLVLYLPGGKCAGKQRNYTAPTLFSQL